MKRNTLIILLISLVGVGMLAVGGASATDDPYETFIGEMGYDVDESGPLPDRFDNDAVIILEDTSGDDLDPSNVSVEQSDGSAIDANVIDVDTNSVDIVIPESESDGDEMDVDVIVDDIVIDTITVEFNIVADTESADIGYDRLQDAESVNVTLDNDELPDDDIVEIHFKTDAGSETPPSLTSDPDDTNTTTVDLTEEEGWSDYLNNLDDSNDTTWYVHPEVIEIEADGTTLIDRSTAPIGGGDGSNHTLIIGAAALLVALLMIRD